MSGVTQTWTLASPGPVLVAAPLPLTRPYQASQSFLGFGLVQPFVRDQRGDFAARGNVELVMSCVEQVLMTRCSNGNVQGELPWRPEFGSLLYLLRQRNLDDTTRNLARVYVGDALRRWEPRVMLKAVSPSQEDSSASGKGDALVIRLKYDIIRANVPGNNVVVPNVQQTVTLTAA